MKIKLNTLPALLASLLVCLSSSAFAIDAVKMMIPANPGGGWDGTGRALGKSMIDAGVAKTVSYENKGGAAGLVALPGYLNGNKADPSSVIVMGAVMVGGIIQAKSNVSISQATPIARLSSEFNVFVVPAASPIKTMKDVVEMMKKDIGSVKFGGGSRGSTDHISVAMIAREAGLDASKINYVPFRGGGEAVTAVLGNNVTVGTSGYSEFAEFITSGKMRAIAVTSPKRLQGVAIPTLIEQGINVDIGNWRGLFAAPGITPAQQKTLVEAVQKTVKHKSWLEASEKNNWTQYPLYGNDFGKFVDDEFARLRAVMAKSGM